MPVKINHKHIRIALALILLGIALGLVRGIAYANAGLDAGFNGTGKLTEDILRKNDSAQAVAIQADGKIVVGGQTQRTNPGDYDAVLARFNPNGTRDTTFGAKTGAGGIVVQNLREGEDGITGLAIQPDGRIVVAGYAGFPTGLHLGVGLYHRDGNGVIGFGTSNIPGWAFYCKGLNGDCRDNFTDAANSVALQPDGKIVAVGWIKANAGPADFLVVRFNANGTRDTTFGAGGEVRTDFFGGVDEVRAVAIQPDGKIVVLGDAQMSGSNYDFALARYTKTGALDPSFGNQGKATLDFGGGDDRGFGMALQPDGKVMVVGSGRSPNEYDFAIARFQADGALDYSYLRGAGKLKIALGTIGTTDGGRGVLVQPDGRIVAVGYSKGGGNNNFSVLRFNPGGELDLSFFTRSSFDVDFAGGNDIAHAVALQQDGQIVIVGSAVVRSENGSDLAIARILANATPSPNPTATPTLTPAHEVTPTPTALSTDSRFFTATGHSVGGLFLSYWDEHGGLAQQGFPITEELQEKSGTDGNTYTMQYFERAVFEHHPENQPPFNVLLSLLGVFYYNEKYAGNAPNQHASTDNPRKFAETGKTIGGAFRKYWETHGGLAQQGFPISDEFQEKSDTDGKTYTVQYFQRAVFEFHPEFAGTPNEVLLSLLGVYFHERKDGRG